MKTYLLLLCLTLAPLVSFAQLERKQVASVSEEVELTFDASRVGTIWSVESLPKKELQISIMHNFGEVNTGVRNLFGLDNANNVRLGFEYGISDNVSAFFGRSSLDKVLDGGLKVSLLRQTVDDSKPVSISLIGAGAITTAEYRFLVADDYTFGDRWSYSGSVLVARKFSEKFSAQVSPMFAVFNRIGPELNLGGTDQFYFSVATAARLKVTKRTSLTAQYVPSFDENVRSNLAFGVDLETGGHVFQLFFTNTSAFNDMYLLAGNNGNWADQEFRLGFIVNRAFSTGKR